jgi:hypothetical protein
MAAHPPSWMRATFAEHPALPVEWVERIVRYTTEGTGMCG